MHQCVTEKEVKKKGFYQLHGLLSLVTGGKESFWLSVRFGPDSLTGQSVVSVVSVALSAPPGAALDLKPEPQLCSQPQNP